MPMESDLPQQLEQRDRERLRAYREHLEFYGGAQWRGSPRQRERRLTFNYVRAFIDKLASYLTDGMSVMVEPWDSSPEAADRSRRGQEALLSIAASSALEQLDYETEVDTAILGDGCYKVTWDAESGDGGDGRVRVTAPDVQGVFAWWAGDDMSRLWRVASRYPLAAEEAEALYGVRARGGRIVSGRCGWTAGCWRSGPTPTG